MISYLQHSSLQVIVAAAALLMGTTAQAENAVSVQFDGAGFQAASVTPGAGASVTISGPNGYYVQRRGASLRVGDGLEDGLYKYEVTLEPITKREREGAEEETVGRTARTVKSGSFRVVNGAVVDPNLQEGAGGQ